MTYSGNLYTLIIWLYRVLRLLEICCSFLHQLGDIAILFDFQYVVQFYQNSNCRFYV